MRDAPSLLTSASLEALASQRLACATGIGAVRSPGEALDVVASVYYNPKQGDLPGISIVCFGFLKNRSKTHMPWGVLLSPLCFGDGP